MFHARRLMGSRRRSSVLSSSCLNTRFLIRRDHEVVFIQRLTFPHPAVEIDDGRMPSSWRHSHSVVVLTASTTPLSITARRTSSMLKRENGRSNCAGSSHAIALTEATCLGGKRAGPSGSRPLFERLEAFEMEPLSHPTDKRTRRVQPCRDCHVVRPIRCVQDHPCPDDLSIGCLRRSRSPFNHSTLVVAQLDPIRSRPSHVRPSSIERCL